MVRDGDPLLFGGCARFFFVGGNKHGSMGLLDLRAGGWLVGMGAGFGRGGLECLGEGGGVRVPGRGVPWGREFEYPGMGVRVPRTSEHGVPKIG